MINVNDSHLEIIIIIVSIFFLLFSKLNFVNQIIYRSFGNLIKKENILYISIFLSIFLSLEYWIFGNSSLLNLYDEGDSKFPLALWKTNHEQFQFSHNILGGIFTEAISFSSRYLNFNIFILNIFNSYFSYVLLKIIVYLACLFGCLKLLMKHTDNICLSLFLSIIYLYSHPYIYNTNFSHGIGYAGIPLSLYVCYHLNYQKSKFIIFSYCLFLSTFSSFPHSFMPLMLSLFVYLIFQLKINFHKKKINFHKYLFFVIAVSILTLINHFYYIFYILVNSAEIARVGLKDAYTTSNILIFFYSKFTFGVLWLLLILFFSIFFIYKKKYFYLFILFIPAIFTTSIEYLSHLKMFNLIKSIRFDLFLFSYPIILILIFIKHFKNLYNNKLAKNIFFFFFLCIFFNVKLFNIAGWLQSNSFKANYIINKEQEFFLVKKQIISENKYFESNFRSVMVPSKANPGAFFWYHDISSLDGHSNFFYKKFVTAYSNAVKFEISHNEFLITERHKIKFRNFHAEGKQSLSEFIDLNFLKENAVKYVFSKIPLKEEGMKLVLEPRYKEKYSNFYNIQLENILRNFRNAEFYIYELDNPKSIFSIESRYNYDMPEICKITSDQILKTNYGWSVKFNDCQKKNIKDLDLVVSLPNVNKIKILDQNEKLIDKYVENEKLFFKIFGSVIKSNDTIFINPYY